MTPPIRELLGHIVEYGREAIDFVGERDADEIAADRLRERAVLHTVQIVGEASANLLKQQPEGFDGLALRGAAGLRNIIVHGYAKVRLERLVAVVRDELPGLVDGAARLLAQGEDTE